MANKTFTPVGTRISDSPSVNVIGITTETTLFTDTIPANTLVGGKFYPFRIDLSLTTPAINLSTITFKVKYGSQTYTAITAAAMVGALTNAPITIQGYLVGRTNSSQFITTTVSQPAGNAVTLNFTNSNMRGTLSVDANTSQTFAVTVQLGGIGAGATTLNTDWILRSDY